MKSHLFNCSNTWKR